VVGDTLHQWELLVPDNSINGIHRVDPRAPRGFWKRAAARAAATKAGAALHRSIAARLDASLMRITGGRVNLTGALPVVVLTTTGARTGMRRESPLTYFTDGEAVIVVASNYGGARCPGWYYNLLANPRCELHIGPHGGVFEAHEATGTERERLFALAGEHYPGYADYAQRLDEIRPVPVMRLTPAS
jgi:deazaflavin-dependent oxidoreductase (nitroreductase family)